MTEPQSPQQETPQAAQVDENPQAAPLNENPQAAQVGETPQTALPNQNPQAAQVNENPQAAQVDENPQAAPLNENPQVAQVGENPQAANWFAPAQSTSALLVCQNLGKRYKNRLALFNANLCIGRGRFVGLLGPNGAGKTTLIKLLCGLLTPDQGKILIDGRAPGVYTSSIVSYLPDRPYFNEKMRVCTLFDFFADFYMDFDRRKAEEMTRLLGINPRDRLKTLSLGTKEKVQLILVMSRRAMLYILDEPIAGVDPAARDYILRTILSGYTENASVLMSTHLISDVEPVLDEVVFLKDGQILLHDTADALREAHGKSVDALFREVFACASY